MQPELERGDDPEVAAAPADGPEQIGVLVGRGPQDPAIGGDDFRGDQVVDAQAVVPGQPAHAAAQDESPDAGVTDQPGGDGQPVGLGRRVHVSQQRAAADRGPLRGGVDRDRVHEAEVDHQAVVADGRAGRVVRASAYGQFEPVLAGETDRRDHVRNRGAARDRRRTPVDLPVEHLAPFIEV